MRFVVRIEWNNQFLKFVGVGLEESAEDYDNEFVRKLQTSVANIKTSREMEARYMLLLKEWIEEEQLRQETDLDILKEYFRKARKGSSIEEFRKMISNH